MPLFWCARHGRFEDHRTQDCRLPANQTLARRLEAVRQREEARQEAVRALQQLAAQRQTEAEAEERLARFEAERIEAIRQFFQAQRD
jgi:hypothetical protein